MSDDELSKILAEASIVEQRQAIGAIARQDPASRGDRFAMSGPVKSSRILRSQKPPAFFGHGVKGDLQEEEEEVVEGSSPWGDQSSPKFSAARRGNKKARVRKDEESPASVLPSRAPRVSGRRVLPPLLPKSAVGGFLDRALQVSHSAWQRNESHYSAASAEDHEG